MKISDSIDGLKRSLLDDIGPEGQVKSRVLQFMRAHKMRAGDALNIRALRFQIMKWDPPEQDVAEKIINQMVTDGILTNDFKLTDAGYMDLY